MAFPSPTKTWHNTSYPSISPTRPELSAKGKVVFITGGGIGIGPKVAAAFADAGSKKIAILGRTLKALSATQTTLESSHPGLTVLPLVADITDSVAVNLAFTAAKQKLGPIDVLVSSAGYMADKASIAEADIAEWWRGLEVNVKGNMIVAQAFLNNRAAENSTIIAYTTGAAHLPAVNGFSSYAVSKLSMIKLYDYLASEYPDVRVFNVHPGVIMTEMGYKALDGGIEFPQDDVSLTAGFTVWAASKESEFLRGRVLWSNWDVDELMEKKNEFDDGGKFTVGLLQWP
jgi:NAD(P)-dependent dehydrogenase (short-subunit alcohol dehydrogenase family)